MIRKKAKVTGRNAFTRTRMNSLLCLLWWREMLHPAKCSLRFPEAFPGPAAVWQGHEGWPEPQEGLRPVLPSAEGQGFLFFIHALISTSIRSVSTPPSATADSGASAGNVGFQPFQ